MTLTLPLHIITPLSHAMNVGTSTIFGAISIVFFSYGISAIVLASASDASGAKNILIMAQCTSITGLLIAASAQNIIMLYIGFALFGIGTGPYTSVARALISRHSPDILKMKKYYAIMSSCIVIAPIMSSYLSRGLVSENWRLAYLVMAIIEICVLTYSHKILAKDAQYQKLIPWKSLIHNFKNSLSCSLFVLNTIALSLVFAFYIRHSAPKSLIF